MYVNLYIDVIFFVNFFMDFLLLILLRKLLKKTSSLKRIVLGAVFGGVFGCLAVFLWFLPVWFLAALSLGTAGIMAGIAFGRSDLKEWIKETGGLYLLAILFGGMMEFLDQYTLTGSYLLRIFQGESMYAIPLVTWMFLAAGVCLFVKALWQFGEELLKERRNRYPVMLTDREVTADAVGYLDTGNCLREPYSGQEVQIVSERIWNLFWSPGQKTILIPYHTVGNPCGVMEGIQIETIEIRQLSGKIKIKHPWIAKAPYALTRDESYEVLLHGEIIVPCKTEDINRNNVRKEENVTRKEKKGGITDGD